MAGCHRGRLSWPRLPTASLPSPTVPSDLSMKHEMYRSVDTLSICLLVVYRRCSMKYVEPSYP
ncbi:hypothetical protein VPH35_131110 [Triticum aestivum]